MWVTKESVLKVSWLTDKQKVDFRNSDNIVAEASWWNIEMLKSQVEDYWLDGLANSIEALEVDLWFDGLWGMWFGVGLWGDEDEEWEDEENPYTRKIEAPVYEPSWESVELHELYDNEKAREMIEDINASNISEQEKDFLIECAQRHIVFNYGKIADYYASASPEMQELMEKSALVIVDFDDAIANWHVALTAKLKEVYEQENEE